MAKMKPLDWLAIALLVVGGINWGLIGFFQYNLVDAILGAGNFIGRIIYSAVGLSALYSVFKLGKLE